VYVAKWLYHYQGYPGSRLLVTRSLFSHVAPNASVDRVKIIEAGGRSAVLIEPIRLEGLGQLGGAGTNAEVIFPEPFGMTTVSAHGIPLAELLEVAEIVGQATK